MFHFHLQNIRPANRCLQCLIRDGPELWDMLFHPKNESHGKIVEIKDESSSSTVTKTA